MMRAIDSFEGTFIVTIALRLAPLLFVRPGELRQALWQDIDFKTANWTIPAHRMKGKTDHIVPLSKQAVSLLKEIHPVTGSQQFVFPGARTQSRPMSEAALNAALRRLGYDKTQFTGHGFRAMARTLIAEQLEYRIDCIEMQLAHSVRDANGRAYNRATFIEHRRQMMQDWSDYLDKLKNGEV